MTGTEASRRRRRGPPPYPHRMLVAWALVVAAVTYGFYLNSQTANRVELEGAIRNHSLCESVNDLRAEIRAFLAGVPGRDVRELTDERRRFIESAFLPVDCPPLPEGWESMEGSS